MRMYFIWKERLRVISRRTKASFFVAALLFVPPSARSQNVNIVFEHFSPDQGMSAGTVPYIYQDSVGYLWFGTFGGVDRYDGYSFTSYKHDPEDPSSLVDAFVNTLCEDRAGNFWVGTANGLDRLDRATGKFTHYMPDPPGLETKRSNYIHFIHEDKDGVLWIGTRDGLDIFDRSSGKFRCFRDDSTDLGGSGNNSIRTMCEDRTGSLWIGTDRGLNRFDKKSSKFIHYWHDFTHMDQWGNWINSIYEDDSGILWLGGGSGLVAFDQETGTFIQYGHDPKDSRSLSSNEVCSISGDKAGQLWVGTYLHGLNVFDRKTKRFTHYVHNEKEPGSLSSDGIQSVYCERSGTIWVSTIDQGVNKLNRAKPPFTNYPYDDQAPYTVSPQAFADNADRIWVHATNEWKKFDPKTETFLRQPLDKGSYPLLDDRAGNLWIGKESGGLYKRDHHGNTTIFHDSSGLKFRQVVNYFIESHDGRLWMGTEAGGFFAVDPAKHSVRQVHQVGSNINTIYEETSGLLWIGTWADGLLCYDPTRETVVRYTHNPGNTASLSANIVSTVYEDKTGTLWVGAHGLDRFDRAAGTFAHFLPMDVVVKILEDDHGNLWLGTFKGISKFDTKKKRFKNYDVSDGLASNGIRAQSGCRTKNGEVYFGGKGLTRFHPDSIRDNSFVPPIIVTQFRLFEKPTLYSKVVNLSYKDNFISFEFAALSYQSPERNQYAYKMEGLDNDWVYCGTRRYAAYPHLEPGKYIFRVKGSNNDGVWNEEGTSIVVTITPPFWATWWFRGFVFITMLVSVGGSIRYVEMRKLKRRIERLEQEHALELERLRISRDMHDEVGATLTEIAILSELAKTNMREASEAQPQIQKIAERSRQVVDNIGEIIWAINPKNDMLEDLLSYIRHYAVQYFEMTSIRCHCEIPEVVPEFHLSAEARRNIFLVVKETLHNVVKHSKATEAAVQFTFAHGKIEILVHDNGKGFALEGLSRFGNGLTNMRKRIEDIGGTFSIQSQPGCGTKVHVVVGTFN